MKRHKVTLIVETNDDDESVKNLDHYYSRIHREFQINEMYAEVKLVDVEVT